jgi:hypothetical protein
MSKATSFWDFFKQIEGKLKHRSTTFRKMFEHVERFNGPIMIVETGCARLQGNWVGDGCSTVLFDKYVSARNDGSSVQTVDLSPQAVKVCRTLVSDKVKVFQADSVPFLHNFVREAKAKEICVPLFYLDSFDLDWIYWQPSAIHHLKELTSIHGFLKPETLVVVDDCMQDADFVISKGKVAFRDKPKPGGKGRLVAEYAEVVGAKLEFSAYHAGWTGFNAS